MSYHIYGNLAPLGWTELKGEDGTTINECDPITWWRDGGDMYVNSTPKAFKELPYINVEYKGTHYRLHPEHIQVNWD